MVGATVQSFQSRMYGGVLSSSGKEGWGERGERETDHLPSHFRHITTLPTHYILSTNVMSFMVINQIT